MKIICDSCGTKYSISDDKVRGKVFKIRCKKCSHIIVVRGGENADAAEEAAPAVDGGWHIVVDGEQVGPVSDADIRARIERGEIRGDTYTWKEGFADWVKLASVPEFAGLVGEASVPVSIGGDLFPAEGQPANGADRARRPSGARSPLFGGGGGGGEDVFAAPAASARGGGGDLFAAASTAHAPAASEQRWPTSGAAVAGHDGGRVENLTAQRHENSVLFSLSNLQSLAMGGGSAKASASPVTTTAPTPEGSGLIDIRAMAASSMPSGMSLGGESRSSGGFSDDLPAFGSFSPAAPVLLPLPSGSGAPKWIYPVILLMIAAVGGIGWMAFKVMSARSPLEPERVVVQVPVPMPAAEPAKTKNDDGTKPSTVPDDKLPPREEGGKHEGKSADGKSGDGKSSRKSKGSSREGKKSVSSSDEKKASTGVPAAASAAAEASAGKPQSEMDRLLAGGLKSGGKSGGGGEDKKAAAAAAEASGPPLAKNAVVAGMNSVKPKISECYNQFKVPGMAMINVVIGKSGKVTSATAEGKFAGTPSGSCVEKAVKSASFPPSEGLTTKYPFQLK